MAAAVNLQRDAGIMLSNLQILSQFAMLLSRMSSEMMDLGIGRMVFPHDEVAGLSPAPRAARAAKYMTAMGLWCSQMDQTDSGPAPASTCHSCMSCEYFFSGGPAPSGVVCIMLQTLIGYVTLTRMFLRLLLQSGTLVTLCCDDAVRNFSSSYSSVMHSRTFAIV